METSRPETPINTGISNGDGRSKGFFGLHFIYQDSVGPDFLFWQYAFVNKIHNKTFPSDSFATDCISGIYKDPGFELRKTGL